MAGCIRTGLGVFLLVMIAAVGTLAQQPSGSTQDGVFTEAQANRGAEVAQSVCSECHTARYFQGAFFTLWEGATLKELYDLIRGTMPEGNPGSLSARRYTDVLAYILDLNYMPRGRRELNSRNLDILIERGKR